MLDNYEEIYTHEKSNGRRMLASILKVKVDALLFVVGKCPTL
jgi:hypothetical protein